MAKSTAAEAPVQDGKVGEIRLDNVDAKVLAKYLAGESLPISKNATKLVLTYLALVDRLRAEEASLVRCQDCGAWSRDTLDHCPVCGQRDEDPPAAASLATPAPATEPPPSSEQAIEVAAEVLPATRGRERELDEAVARIRSHARDAIANGIALGTEVTRIYNDKLYLERKKGGVTAYKNFKLFCKAELGFTYPQVKRFMVTSARFSQEDIAQIGFTKLSEILKVDHADRHKLLEMAKSNVSLRDLMREVKIIKEKKSPSRSTGSDGAPAARKAPEPQDPKGKLTCEFKQGNVELRASLDPKAKGVYVAREELINGVIQEFLIDTKQFPKHLVLKIRRYRPE